MAKNVRISDDLYALAQWDAQLQDRSIAQQLEHWIKLGIAIEEKTNRATANKIIDATEVAVALTRRLDRLDVLNGKRSADSLFFIPRSIARRSKVVFPKKYQKS